MFPEPTSCCVQFPSITDDDSSTDVNNHCIPIDHSNKTGTILHLLWKTECAFHLF